jgi:hypothetical protein
MKIEVQSKCKYVAQTLYVSLSLFFKVNRGHFHLVQYIHSFIIGSTALCWALASSSVS